MSDANREKAANAEKRAFKHIEGEKWCKATNAFLDAYDYHAAVVYIYNAAKAAEFAKDRKLALQLSLEMMGKFPGSDKQAEVNEMIQALSKEVQSASDQAPLAHGQTRTQLTSTRHAPGRPTGAPSRTKRHPPRTRQRQSLHQRNRSLSPPLSTHARSPNRDEKSMKTRSYSTSSA